MTTVMVVNIHAAALAWRGETFTLAAARKRAWLISRYYDLEGAYSAVVCR